VLAEGRQAHVAIATSGGPHVTPELYAVDGGRLWFLAGHRTLKARVLPRNPAVAVLVRAGERSVSLVGDVASFHPAALPHHAPGAAELFAAPRALARYSVRNAVDLVGFANDFARGRLGRRLPDARVLFSVTPRRVAVLDGFSIVGHDGDWPGSADAGAADVVQPGSAAVAAVSVGDDLLALPARVDDSAAAAQVPRSLLALAAVSGTVDTAVAVDDYGRPGPAAKKGIMLRGRGEVRTDDTGAWLDLDPDRAVYWDGIDTGTVPAP
jgi:hypothetical protein